jgi:hypothetical protein
MACVEPGPLAWGDGRDRSTCEAHDTQPQQAYPQHRAHSMHIDDHMDIMIIRTKSVTELPLRFYPFQDRLLTPAQPAHSEARILIIISRSDPEQVTEIPLRLISFHLQFWISRSDPKQVAEIPLRHSSFRRRLLILSWCERVTGERIRTSGIAHCAPLTVLNGARWRRFRCPALLQHY